MTDPHSSKINHGCFKEKYVQKVPTSARHTHHTDVTKLVCSSHSVVIQERCCSDPPRVSVISKDNELVLIPFVTHPDETLLNIWDNHSVPNGLNPTDVVGNVLLREKGQNLSASSRGSITLHQLKHYFPLWTTVHSPFPIISSTSLISAIL